MMRSLALLSMLLTLWTTVGAHDAELRPFASGSYAQLLAVREGRPFILVLWSTACASCVKQLPLLQELSRQNPRVAMVLVTTDAASARKAAVETLTRSGLEHEDNWIFADTDVSKLRAEIDAAWDGKLPRTYLYDAAHNRQTLSGALNRDRVLGWSRQATAVH